MPTVFTPMPGPEPGVGDRNASNPNVAGVAHAHYARSGEFAAAINELEARVGDPDAASLGLIRSGLAMRAERPFRWVACGSSTTEGYNASTAVNRWVNLFAAKLQAKWPAAGAEAATVALGTAPAGAGGVQMFNAGAGGTTSWTYLNETKMGQIAQLSPQVVSHMVGSNDYASGVSPSDYKFYLTHWLNLIDDAQVGATHPPVHILVHQHGRADPTSQSAQWTWGEYGQAMREVAASRNRVLFVDVSAEAQAVGLPEPDFYDLLEPDATHLDDRGHAWLADLLWAKLFDGAPMVTGPLAAAIQVKPIPPVFVDDSGSNDDRVIIPVAPGVSYSINGVVQAAGTYPASGATTVTAAPSTASYGLYGPTTWAHTFTSAVLPGGTRVENMITSDDFSNTADGTSLLSRRSDAVFGGDPRRYQLFGVATVQSANGVVSGTTFTGFTVEDPAVSITVKIVSIVTDSMTLASRRNMLSGATRQVRILLAPGGGITWSAPGATNTSGTDGTGTWAAGDEIELWSLGSTHRVYRNGSLIMQCQATVDVTGYCGVGAMSGTSTIAWLKVSHRTV